MGMTIDGEGAAPIVVASPPPPSADPVPPPPPLLPSALVADVAGPHGQGETSEEKALRERSNSEETALILTSMMSMTKGSASTPRDGSDDDSDMGDDDMSDDDGDGSGKRKRRVQHVHFGGPTGSKLDFTDDAGFNHRFRNESNRVKSLVTKHISIDELREHFDRPIIDVAKDFGICITLMKKICRRNGIKRWPHRQIRSLSKSIASMEAAMLSSQGPEREKYRDQILSLKLKRDSVIADPNKENGMSRPKTPTKDTTSRPHAHVHATPKLSPRSGSPPTTTTPHKEHSKGGRWTSEEHAAFLHGIRLYGKDWRRVAQVVRTRSAVQTRTHAQKYLLKFAGRFPFDADGLELKQEPETPSPPHGQSPVAAVNEKETDGAETASVSSSSLDDDTMTTAREAAPLTVDATATKTSALETMAMILNSPQFNGSGSFKRLAPPAIQTQLPPRKDDGDVAMESPHSGGSTLLTPLLPSFVIQSGAWPTPLPDAEAPTNISHDTDESVTRDVSQSGP